MTDLMSMFFGPLDKNACIYFYIVTVIFFIGFLILIVNEAIFIIQNVNKLSFRMITGGIVILFNIFVAYFVNRLLYNMCVKSLA